MTLQEFKDWALEEGSVGKYDDGGFVGQCVSLVNQYCYRVLGVPAGVWGHAYAWANDNNPNRQYFDKVGDIQPGDVVVYGTNFTPDYGHIGIALGGGQILDQNGHKSLAVATGALYNGYAAILRSKTQGDTNMDYKEQYEATKGELEGERAGYQALLADHNALKGELEGERAGYAALLVDKNNLAAEVERLKNQPTKSAADPIIVPVTKELPVEDLKSRLSSRTFWITVVSVASLLLHGDVNAAVAVIYGYFTANAVQKHINK